MQASDTTPSYPVWGLVDQRPARDTVDVAWASLLCGVSLMGSGTLFVNGWMNGNTLLALAGLLPLLAATPMWNTILATHLTAWTHGHLPLAAMARVVQDVIRAHLAGHDAPNQPLAPVRAYWRLGSGGAHLHEVRIQNKPIDVDNAHSAILSYNAATFFGRTLGGLCGRYAITAKTDTMLEVRSAHHLLHLLCADATIFPPGPRRNDSNPRDVP